MKDLIIGIFIGALITTGVFFYSNTLTKVTKLEVKIEMLCKDIDRIALKIGPLPEKRKETIKNDSRNRN